MNKATMLASLLLATSPVFADNQHQQKTPTTVPDTTQRYIVMFDHEISQNHQQSTKTTGQLSVFDKQEFSPTQASNMINTIGGQTIHALPSISGMAVQLSDQQLKQLKSNPQVALIEPDPLRTFQAEVQPYGIGQIQADQLSDANTGNIKICITDTGIALGHEDLPDASNITGEVSNTLTAEMDIGEWSQDTYGHGTHMAGTIVAVGGNNLGISGINPGGNIKLHVVKIVDNPGWWPFRGSDLIAAVERCQAAGANIINMSIAGNNSSVAEQQAMQAAYDAGVLLIGASGRGGSSEHKYPASYDSVISAAAIDAQEAVWQFSHFNDQIELSAPGVNVKSLVSNNQYANLDGTSVASAYISGAAGLVWSYHPACSNVQIRNILQQTAKDLAGVGRDDNTGYGLVQVKAAVDLIDQRGCSGNGTFNNPPTITGNPLNSVNEGELYQFTPIFADADDGDILTLNILNKPAWASFDAQTGELSGTPDDSDAGIYNDIAITVTDSNGASASTLLFSIEVVNVDFPELPGSIFESLSVVGSDIVFTNPDGSIMTVGSINDGDWDPTNELQSISKVDYTVTLSDGGSVSVNDADADSANELQTLSQVGNKVTLSDGGGTVSIDDADANSTNEIQTLQGVLSQGNGGGGNEITNIAEPTTGQSVATKSYVDSSIAAVQADLLREIPPMVFDVYNDDTTTYACVEKDIQEHCGDENGCTIRLVMQHETSTIDEIRMLDEHLYIEGNLSNNNGAGLNGRNQQEDGWVSIFTLGNGVRNTIFRPWAWAWGFNYRHQNCNGGIQGPAFTGENKYKLLFMSHPLVKTKFIIYDR